MLFCFGGEWGSGWWVVGCVHVQCTLRTVKIESGRGRNHLALRSTCTTIVNIPYLSISNFINFYNFLIANIYCNNTDGRLVVFMYGLDWIISICMQAYLWFANFISYLLFIISHYIITFHNARLLRYEPNHAKRLHLLLNVGINHHKYTHITRTSNQFGLKFL